MDNTLNLNVEVKHFGYGFRVSENGDIEMRIPIKQLKKGDVIVNFNACDETVTVERKLENVEVIAKKIIG